MPDNTEFSLYQARRSLVLTISFEHRREKITLIMRFLYEFELSNVIRSLLSLDLSRILLLSISRKLQV